MARWRSSQRSSLIRRRSRVRFPLELPIRRSVAEQQMQRAVNAPSCGTTEVRVLPLRPFLHPTRRKRRTAMVRQTAGRMSLWMLHFCGRGGIAYAPARGAGGREPMRVQPPSSAPFFRGVVGTSRHGGFKLRRATEPVPVQLRPPRPMRPCVEPVDRAVLKTAAPFGAWACNSPPAAPDFSASGGMHTRESQTLVDESSCRCESCLADQFLRLVL